MKAIGRYIIISEIKEDIRYRTADVISVGTAVEGVNIKDKIYYDRHAGHNIEIGKDIYKVIQEQDVIIVL